MDMSSTRKRTGASEAASARPDVTAVRVLLSSINGGSLKLWAIYPHSSGVGYVPRECSADWAEGKRFGLIEQLALEGEALNYYAEREARAILAETEPTQAPWSEPYVASGLARELIAGRALAEALTAFVNE
jgi:hypothetical protein